ncbi:unnamed protein product [Brassica oleracea]
MDAASEGSNLMEKAGSEQEDIRHTIAQAVSVIKMMLIFQIVVIDICLEDVILRAVQMEQIVEKVCEERLLILEFQRFPFIFTSSFIFSKVGN